MPWSKTHLRMRRTHLDWWQQRLGLQKLADLDDDALPRVEAEIRELQARDKAPKTIANHCESLRSFCRWALQRGYLGRDPLAGMAALDTTPRVTRRAMSREEMERFLKAVPEDLRPTHEVAFATGLRASELRELSADDLDVENCGPRLHATWTKSRKPGFKRLPAALVSRLVASLEAGIAKRLYATFCGKRGTDPDVPAEPLVYVPSHPARMVDKYLAVAGIPKHTPAGKLNFHAIRTAYINFVLESGATVKEAMELARHSTPNLTLNTYGRAREDRLHELTEKVGALVLPSEKCAHSVREMAAGAEGLDLNLLRRQGLKVGKDWWRRRELNPRPVTFQLGLLRT